MVFLTSFAWYPLCISLSVNWVVISVNVNLFLGVSPVAMAFLHAFGWYDVLWIYSCLFVFLCQVCWLCGS